MSDITRRTFLSASPVFALLPRHFAGSPLKGRSSPPRLRRSESFLGIHFDFHADVDSTEIGKRTTREMIETIIRQVKPDYIQIDCKGHRGLSSYPTRAGNRAPGFVGDQLRVWRDVTAEYGVALFMHYSGVADDEAIRRHPDWAVVDTTGKADSRATSVFGPYVNELLIPQLEELADVYGVDGAWVDGDCWATKPDYSPAAIRQLRMRTGMPDALPSMSAQASIDVLEFCREGFRRYLRHYVDVVHQHRPTFQIASNWSFSHFMPEPVTADVDWLGDYSQTDSVNSARLAARYLSSQGKPWDLMAWSFAGPPNAGRSQKSATQLQREAAIVLALGGGFQAYFHQRRDASIDVQQMPLMREVAEFARARQPFCHGTETVPQIGLLYSTAAYYQKSPRLFSPGDVAEATIGILQNLLDCQHAVDVLSEHHLKGRLHLWPLIVVPEWEYLEDSFRADLVSYARNGGRLVLIGPKTTSLFADDVGIIASGAISDPNSLHYLEYESNLASLRCSAVAVQPLEGTASRGWLLGREDRAAPGTPAATIRSIGKGKIAAVWLTLGRAYRSGRTIVARDFLNALVSELFPDPLVSISGSHFVDVVIRKSAGQLRINLVNTSGPHEDQRQPVFDEIPSVGSLTASIRLNAEPRVITTEPSGESLPFEFRNGLATVSVPNISIHNILVVHNS